MYNGPIIPFGALVEYHPVTSEQLSEEAAKRVAPFCDAAHFTRSEVLDAASLPRVVNDLVLFLCFNFTVPSTTRSLRASSRHW